MNMPTRAELAAIRRFAVADLYKAGWKLSEIGEQLGTSSGAVQQDLVMMRRAGKKIKRRRARSGRRT